MDGAASPTPVAVISSYALPLLEGCGSIKKGDLKIIGKTGPVPFITAFVSESMSPEKQKRVLDLLLSLKSSAALLKALESKQGFKPMEAPELPKLRNTGIGEWPDWRGPGRDGHVPQLPARLPAEPQFVWKKAAVIGGLSGLCVAEGRVLVAERDFGNQNDVLRCLDGNTGEALWRAEFPATGKLDYGEAPRATPVVSHGKVLLLGAFGDLRCLDLKSGKPLWHRQLIKEFNAKLPTWGTCSTPLLTDGLLIVNPGAVDASLVALDPATGRTVWKTAGKPSAYASFISAEFGGRRQIVGYDQNSLGGWDVKTGERLWHLVPPNAGDFNVPTPLAVKGNLFVATENNGARLYGFDLNGKIIPKPMGEYADLSPDTTSPVVSGDRIFGTHQGIHCLDARQNLKKLWQLEDTEIGEHASLFASDDRVLIVTLDGELILVSAQGEGCEILSRVRVFKDDVELYSHPALAGSRLYIRSGSTVACLELGER
jgi:outer membrane protein assembly factor BamB